jgi:hypothetical protein
MDFFEFVQKSEWPVLVGGVIWYFREPIKQLLTELRLTKFAPWGLSAEFERRLDKVEDLTETTRELADKAPKKPRARSTKRFWDSSPMSRHSLSF